MTDVFSKQKRSEIMRSVYGQRTTPERIVEQIVRRFRFRPVLNDRSLPGAPDLVFPRRRKVIFVHGCFWHRHACKAGRSTPTSNVEYWQAKFACNKKRDAKVRAELRKAGWSALIVWECQTRVKHQARLEKKLLAFLRK